MLPVQFTNRSPANNWNKKGVFQRVSSIKMDVSFAGIHGYGSVSGINFRYAGPTNNDVRKQSLSFQLIHITIFA